MGSHPTSAGTNVFIFLSLSFPISKKEEKSHQTKRLAVGLQSNMAREVPTDGQGTHSTKQKALFVSAVLTPSAPRLSTLGVSWPHLPPTPAHPTPPIFSL